MLQTYTELCEIVDSGYITNVTPDLINAASIDVTLGSVFWREAPSDLKNRPVRLAKRQAPRMECVNLDLGGECTLEPGEFILAQTEQEFYLPNWLAAEFRLKSSGARSGLDQALAVWCDPGWHGSVLTLELKNGLRRTPLTVEPGMKIGQMIFFRGTPVPPAASYALRGQYNLDKTTQPSKGIR